MAQDYSRVLIVDFILSDTKTPLMRASLDIQMMSIGTGVERSERQWRDLLHSDVAGNCRHLEPEPRDGVRD
jgi:hypothetical protein